MSTSRWSSLSSGRNSVLGLGADRVLLPAGEVEQPGERVRGLGARRRIVQAELEHVLVGRMVQAEAEQACDRLGAGTCLRLQAGVAERGRDRAGGITEPEKADERGVELANRDRSTGHDDRIAVLDGLLARERERLERGAERALRQWPLRLERGDGVGEQARFHDRLDLRLGPRAVGPRGGGRQRESAESDGGEATHEASIGTARIRLESMSRCSFACRSRTTSSSRPPASTCTAATGQPSGSTAASIASSRGGRCGSRLLPAVSTSRPHDETIEAEVLHFLGLPFDLDGFYAWAEGDETLGRLAAGLAGFRPPLQVEPVRGARHLDHGAAGLAPVGGGDQEPVHRALRRRGRSTRRLPRARTGGARDRGRADRRRLLDPQGGVRRRARPQRPRPGRARRRSRTRR